MDNVTAENIGKQAKALKHCDKLLAEINKTGSALVKLSSTGVEFTVRQNDAIYCRIQATKYALLDQIRSYELTARSQRAIVQPVHKGSPAPVATVPETETLSDADIAREKRAEYNRRYREKKKGQTLTFVTQ